MGLLFQSQRSIGEFIGVGQKASLYSLIGMRSSRMNMPSVRYRLAPARFSVVLGILFEGPLGLRTIGQHPTHGSLKENVGLRFDVGLVDGLVGLRRRPQHPAHRSLEENIGLRFVLGLGRGFGHGYWYYSKLLLTRGSRWVVTWHHPSPVVHGQSDSGQGQTAVQAALELGGCQTSARGDSANRAEAEGSGNRGSAQSTFQYRAKAQEAREKAASETDDSTRAKLLNDADLWDRMAAFEENTPSQNFQSYYPKK